MPVHLRALHPAAERRCHRRSSLCSRSPQPRAHCPLDLVSLELAPPRLVLIAMTPCGPAPSLGQATQTRRPPLPRSPEPLVAAVMLLCCHAAQTRHPLASRLSRLSRSLPWSRSTLNAACLCLSHMRTPLRRRPGSTALHTPPAACISRSRLLFFREAR